MTAETSQTLDRGLRVLELLSTHPEGLSVTEIAAELGVGRTVVYRLVSTLDQHGFLRRSPDGRCRLGVAALTLSRQIQPMLRDSALPVLRRLADSVGATAHLTLLDGAESLVVAVMEPARTDVYVAYRVGARHQADRSIAGKAALASRPGGRPAEPATVLSGHDPQVGGFSIAAPVHGVPWLEASVGVVSMTDLDPNRVGPVLVTAAADIARLMR